MATEETVQLNEAHAPQQASLDAFSSIIESVKAELLKLRRDHDSTTRNYLPLAHFLTQTEHEVEYFRAVKDVSDRDLSAFSAEDLESVRVAVSAYGLHLFGKVRLPAASDAYIHIRIFGSAKDGTDGSSVDEREYKLHSIHTEEVVKEDGDRVYRAIFKKNDALEWFDT
jgi:hypothetical protein